VDPDREKILLRNASALGLTDEEEADRGAQDRLVKAFILRGVAASEIKLRVTVSGTSGQNAVYGPGSRRKPRA
jgi:hypothetical protein